MQLTEENLLETHGKTFHFATRFFPRELRGPVEILYAFFRTLDNLVDEPDATRQVEDVRLELTAWHDWFIHKRTFLAPRESLGKKLDEVLTRRPVPTTIFLDFLDGIDSDLQPRTIQTFDELYGYCYRVAGTVGLAMTHMLGVHSLQALKAAETLGIAMQLTNILRDIGSDLAVDRIYLPYDELKRFGYSRASLFTLYQQQQMPNQRFCALMQYNIARTHQYYAHSIPGIWLLPPDCRLPILIAARLYQRILTTIERRHYDVLRIRATTSPREKIYEATLAFLLDRLWRQGEVHPIVEMEELLED